LVGKVRIVVDKYRVDASRVRLAVVEVGDESGCVSLRARDEQIDTLLEIANRSGAVVLRNCTLELYQGKHVRLAVTKWGKISAYPDHVYSTPSPPNVINYERNFSMINLSLVASDTMASQSTDQSKPHSQYHAGDNISQENFTNPSNQGLSTNHQRRDRRPSRNTAIPGLPLHSYQNNNTQQNSTSQYSGQQPYTGGFVADGMGGSQYYTPQRQSEVSVQQQQQQHQQIMYQQHHHQYELQQHQMQMYHRSPLLQSQHGPMQYTSPLPFQNTVVSGSRFQVAYSPQGSAAADPHQQQVHGSHLHQQQQFVPLQQIPTQGSPNGMNAQAATYAPGASSHDEQPTQQ
jgi:replication factor A1